MTKPKLVGDETEIFGKKSLGKHHYFELVSFEAFALKLFFKIFLREII